MIIEIEHLKLLQKLKLKLLNNFITVYFYYSGALKNLKRVIKVNLTSQYSKNSFSLFIEVLGQQSINLAIYFNQMAKQ